MNTVAREVLPSAVWLLKGSGFCNISNNTYGLMSANNAAFSIYYA